MVALVEKPRLEEVEDVPAAILEYHQAVTDAPVIYEKHQGPQEHVDGMWLGGSVLSVDEARERRLEPHKNEVITPEDDDFDLDAVNRLIENGVESTDKFMVRPNTSPLNRALAWIWPLIGEMPYGWWTSGAVPSGAPAYAQNAKLGPRAGFMKRTVFCQGVVNLLLRSVGKRVPTYGNPSYDGGTHAAGIYFRDHAKPFRLSEVQPGDLCLDFYCDSNHQGHIGVVLDGNLFLQSFDGNRQMEGGWNGPGLNKLYTIGQSASVTHYDVRIPRDSWINYRGDQPGFAAVA